MTLFALERDIREGEAYTCVRCMKPYIAGSRKLRCAAFHAEGSCCHYTDTPAEPPHEAPEVVRDHSSCGRRRFGSGCVPFKDGE